MRVAAPSSQITLKQAGDGWENLFARWLPSENSISEMTVFLSLVTLLSLYSGE